MRRIERMDTMKSLVVEDEFVSRIILQKVLSRFGECHIAICGEEAVTAYRDALNEGAPYDLICMDIKMSGIDGIEAVRQIRELETSDGVLSSNGTKIIMTSAVEEPKDIMLSFHALCDGYFVKPLDSTLFLTKLRKLHLIPS